LTLSGFEPNHDDSVDRIIICNFSGDRAKKHLNALFACMNVPVALIFSHSNTCARSMYYGLFEPLNLRKMVFEELQEICHSKQCEK